MPHAPLVVEGVGAACAVGLGVPQIESSIRAGLSRIRDSHILDATCEETMRMGLVPDEVLPRAVPGLPAAITARQRRMLRLASLALRQLATQLNEAGRAGPWPIFLGLPEALPGQPPAADERFVSWLGLQSGASLDEPSSRVFPRGRAAALIALEAAAAALTRREASTIVVGGVDTYYDDDLLMQLSLEKRILAGTVTDGFIPGEGAAFLALRLADAHSRGRVGILATATAHDAGHRYSAEPARGEGLPAAIEVLRRELGDQGAPVRTIFTSLNGESFGAKEWGVSRTRHTPFFAPGATLDHPVDAFGDGGAALGALLLAIVHHALTHEKKPGPALVWSSSDMADRACSYLDILH